MKKFALCILMALIIAVSPVNAIAVSAAVLECGAGKNKNYLYYIDFVVSGGPAVITDIMLYYARNIYRRGTLRSNRQRQGSCV